MEKYEIRLALSATKFPAWDWVEVISSNNENEALLAAHRNWQEHSNKIESLEICNQHISRVSLTQKDAASSKAQIEYKKELEDRCNKLLGSKLDGKFSVATYPAGFNYGITHGPNAYYNAATLNDLDARVSTHPDSGELVLSAGDHFSDLYYNILRVSGYRFSEIDQKTINDANIRAASIVGDVVAAFDAAGGQYTDPLPFGGKIGDISDQIVANYGTDIDNIPSSLQELRNALIAYKQAAQESYHLLTRKSEVQSKMMTMEKNMKSPNKANGGMEIGNKKYSIGYTPSKLPTASQMVSSLATDTNSLSISCDITDFQEESSSVSIEAHTSIRVSHWFVANMSINNQTSFSLKKYASSLSTVNMKVTFRGITTIASIPSTTSLTGDTNWYDAEMIDQIVNNTGKDKSGVALLSNEYTVNDFGIEKKFAKLKTFVLSQEPEITFTMTNVDVKSLQRDFSSATSVRANLFGFINISSNSSYTTHSATYNEEARTATITLGAPKPSPSVSLEKQIAYVIGGIPTYPPTYK